MAAPGIFKNKYVLITGGSSGIGFELARLFLKEEAKIILAAGNADKLSKAAQSLESEFNVRVFSIAKDLSQPEAAGQIHQELASKLIPVDVLVNNAGFGISGLFKDADLNKTLRMIELNAKAPVALTGLFLPYMVHNGFGKSLNIASTAAFQGIPLEALYAASKAFIVNFSEGLAEELKGTGVGVTCLCPGATDTPFFDRGTIVASKVMKRSMMTSRRVAQIGLDALKNNRRLVIAGLRNKILILSERLVPRKLATKLAGRMVR